MTISIKELDRLHADRYRDIPALRFSDAIEDHWPAISRALKAGKAAAPYGCTEDIICGKCWACKLDAAMEAFDD